MVKRLKYLSLLVLGVCFLVPNVSDADIIDVNSVRVIDVTPVQFAVVWGTSDAAAGSVNVFADADGNVPVTDAVVQFESAAHPPAEDMGVMKVRVSNLQPSAQYYIQIKTASKEDGTNSLYPESSPFTRVTTMDESRIVENDVLAYKVSVGEGKSTQGTLVIAEIDRADYPVTGWAGDGVPEGWVIIDSNNFYFYDDKLGKHVNLELDEKGGESITLTYFGGSLGSVVTNDTLLAESGGIQQTAVTLSLPGSGGGSSTSTSSDSGGGGGGGSCFIGTALNDLW